MCGIAGILNLGIQSAPERCDLRPMIEPLRHRGPDDTGFYCDEDIGLAHARLSIIDLTTGKQPMHNEDRTVWVVFNGEVFNFIELRRELEDAGHRFYTHSDTEVLVHLYEEYGTGFVRHLNGQFAMALWDKRKQVLLLVRDRVGIVPLFYTEDHNRLLFASEVKGILPVRKAASRLNCRALDQLFTFWSPVSPETVFEGVLEVPPGQMLVVTGGCMKMQCYWDWSFPVDDAYKAGTDESLAGKLHDLLVDATKIRLRSDVPVGAYLSGGLDSSVLVSLIHHYGNVPLRTFSLEFSDKSLDESGFQSQLIRHLNTEHSSIQCHDADIANHFEQAIWHTESPILRTAPVPMMLLSGLVRKQHYKVVLTGEGADEVLGGYDLFKEGKIRQFWASQPGSRLRPLLLKRLYPYLDISKAQTLSYLTDFFGKQLDQSYLPWFSHIPRWNTTARTKIFFSDALNAHFSDHAIEMFERSLPGDIGSWHSFNQAQYIESKSLMSGYLLCSQGDRMLMANSVEGRFPFLDHRVIEFANQLRPALKMKVLNEKYILKKAMAQYLPGSIVKRYKQPYRAPNLPAFFGRNTPDYVHDLLSKGALSESGYFNPAKVARLLAKIEKGHAIGNTDSMAFVGVLSTQMWHHLFIK